MAETDRVRWDRRYANPDALKRKDGPDALLVRHTPPAGPGARALELACGLGHNAIWLAEQGYTVDALDISLTALRLARETMLARGVRGVHFVAADLDHFPLPERQYDVVCVFRFLDRALFPALRERVRSGGVIVYQTLNTGHLEKHPDTRPDHMLRRGELPQQFPGWTVLEAADLEHISLFAARKPPA
ncbi:MAG TPA: class I SAM-dependent methyltransferase [Aggregatilineaceae bacterium]|jgi:SAM-dependent methyltransferase|nr:class I SAM-dependent methyltransferase [Anaerolineae bacterium]HMM28352.1 class I SAM-dependent methyltransferase [Aggregatilineaceae bacterium]